MRGGNAWRSLAAASGVALFTVVATGCGSSTAKPAAQEALPVVTTTSSVARSTTTTTRPRPTTTTAAPTTVPVTTPPVTRAPVRVTPQTVPAPPPPPPPPPNPLAMGVASVAPASGAEGALVAGINNFRASHGLPALAVHSNLVSKARGWAAHMAGGGCGLGNGGVPNICHSVLADGIVVHWSLLAENVGMVAPVNASTMEGAFEQSPPHAENMLNGQMQFVGVGVAVVGDKMYAAEEFMKG